jgi:hypothetical protein
MRNEKLQATEGWTKLHTPPRIATRTTTRSTSASSFLLDRMWMWRGVIPAWQNVNVKRCDIKILIKSHFMGKVWNSVYLFLWELSSWNMGGLRQRIPRIKCDHILGSVFPPVILTNRSTPIPILIMYIQTIAVRTSLWRFVHSSSRHFVEMNGHFTLRPSYFPEKGFSAFTVKAGLRA